MKIVESYKSVDAASEILKETGDLSYYQEYKSSTVSKFLLPVMDNIVKENYDLCEVCTKEILIGRLKIVPGALSCVTCNKKKVIL